jgi:hypothetical protein
LTERKKLTALTADKLCECLVGETLPANEGCAWNFDDSDGHPRQVSAPPTIPLSIVNAFRAITRLSKAA